MRGPFRILLALVLLVAAVVLLAPAAVLDAPLAARSGQRLRLIETTGFWWRGAGILATTDGAIRVPLGWRLHFASLPAGTLTVEFLPAANGSLASGTLVVRQDDVAARNLHLVVPADLVSALVPALQTVSLHGGIDIDAPSIAWRRGIVTGNVAANWRAAQVAVAGAWAIDLGDVR